MSEGANLGRKDSWPASFLNWASPYPPQGPDGKSSRLGSSLKSSLKRKESGLPPVPAAAYPIDEKPALEPSQSEAELQEALQRSEQEAALEQSREERELMEAMEASRLSASAKGKGKAPQRQSLMDEETQLAMALSMSSSADQAAFPVDTDDFDEEAQRRELERFQLSRASMFDTNDASSLSIISERTEANTPFLDDSEPLPKSHHQATSHVGDPSLTPLVPREEPPSYFNLWRSSDAQTSVNEKEKMTILPPISEMIAQAPSAPRPSKRPLPPIPVKATSQSMPAPTAQRNMSFGSDFVPSFVESENLDDDDTASVRTVRSPEPQASILESYFTPHSDLSSGEIPSGPSNSAATSDQNHSHTAEEAAEDVRSESPAPFSSYNTTTPSINAPSTITPKASDRPNRELVWPQNASTAQSNLPPGARSSRNNTQTDETALASVPALEDEEEAFAPRAIRYGFSTIQSPTLPFSKETDAFPDVVQLSNSSEEGEEPEFTTFAMEAPTWNALLRFLSLHGDCRIEAHPADIQNEKIGHGESEISANFVKSSSGSGESVVRLSVRLLPPSSTIGGRPSLPNLSTQTSTKSKASKNNNVTPSDVPLPDHLILPVRMNEIANMLFTMRHLASIAVATHDVKKPAKNTSSSYDAILALGLRINQLAAEHASLNGASGNEAQKVRLRDRLKAKLRG